MVKIENEVLISLSEGCVMGIAYPVQKETEATPALDCLLGLKVTTRATTETTSNHIV